MPLRLNVSRLIHDAGGATKVAKDAGAHRTVPYRWIKENKVPSTVLEHIVEHNPNIKINDYIEDTHVTEQG